MNIIIPMAGRGTRLRPHTLTTPKPLLQVGGKAIVHRLVEDIATTLSGKINQIAFIIGDFGSEVEQELLQIAHQLNAKAFIYHQTEALGTAHAVLCAREQLKGPTVVAYADTLFQANFKISPEDQGILWVKKIPDPSAFGVVELNENNEIVRFVEKPKHVVSDLAMIGIYYFKEGEILCQELDYLVDNKLDRQGEYQLPDALARMVEKGVIFRPGSVDEWLDCGNKEATVQSNQRVLEHDQRKNNLFLSPSAKLENSVIIQPCFIGNNVQISNSVVGPHVSIGEGSKVSDSRIQNSIIGKFSTLKNVIISDSMLGSKVNLESLARNLSVGDYSVVD